MRKARDSFLFMYISLELLLEVLVQLSPPNTQTADLTITLKVHPTYPRRIMRHVLKMPTDELSHSMVLIIFMLTSSPT